MEVHVEIFFELFFDVMLELIFSGLGEAALKRQHRPGVAAVSSVVLGAMVAIATLWVLPHPLIRSEQARLVNLAFSPLFVGAVLGMRGYLTARPRFLVRSAVNGVLLALTMGLVRYFGAH